MDKKNEKTDYQTIKELNPNIAALLCYVGGWISGIVFLILEKKNLFIRFHALQSIIVFGILTIASMVLGNIPHVGTIFSWLIFTLGFALWLVLMLTAYAGEKLKMLWVGNLAERLSLEYTQQIDKEEYKQQEQAQSTAESNIKNNVKQSSTKISFKNKYYSGRAWRRRIIGSSFTIVWSVVLLLFFNFYYRYIAYYEHVTEGDIERWQISPLVTTNIHEWLPILTAVLAVVILTHIIFIIIDRFLLRQIMEIVLNGLNILVVASLLAIFPFDFNVLPDTDVARWVQIGVTVTLILVIVGIAIDTLVRVIKLIINTIEGKY